MSQPTATRRHLLSPLRTFTQIPSPPRSRSRHWAYPRSRPSFSRATVAGDRPRADPKSFVDTPLHRNQGITASTRPVFFRQGGSSSGRKHRPAATPGVARGLVLLREVPQFRLHRLADDALRARAQQFTQFVPKGWIHEGNRRIFLHGGASPPC